MEIQYDCSICLNKYPKIPKSHASKCPSCYQKEYYQKNKQAYYEYNKAWREANPGKKSEQSKRHYIKYPEKYYLKDRNKRMKELYGISHADTVKMAEQQGYKCMICNRQFQLGSRYGLAVDHCHKTGKPRSLLCPGCNRGLGNFEENLDSLQKAIEYLKTHNS